MAKLIVGLGNPGYIYANTRHNIGFSIIRALSKAYKAPLKKDKKTFCLSAKTKIGSQHLILAMPLTFMNLSGIAVRALLESYALRSEDLLAACDDLDLELGMVRIRPGGSSGGHRGLQSIADSLGSQNFARLRIGIGRPPKNTEASDYVLRPFLKREKAFVSESKEKAFDCCKVWAAKGITEAMNTFNK